MYTGRQKSCFQSFPTTITFDAVTVLHGDDTARTNLSADSAANAGFRVHKNNTIVFSGDRTGRTGFHTLSTVGAAHGNISEGFFLEDHIAKRLFALLRMNIPLIHTSHLTGLTAGTFLFVKFDHVSDLLLDAAADTAIAGESGIGISMVIVKQAVGICFAITVV